MIVLLDARPLPKMKLPKLWRPVVRVRWNFGIAIPSDTFAEPLGDDLWRDFQRCVSPEMCEQFTLKNFEDQAVIISELIRTGGLFEHPEYVRADPAE